MENVTSFIFVLTVCMPMTVITPPVIKIKRVSIKQEIKFKTDAAIVKCINICHQKPYHACVPTATMKSIGIHGLVIIAFPQGNNLKLQKLHTERLLSTPTHATTTPITTCEVLHKLSLSLSTTPVVIHILVYMVLFLLLFSSGK